MTNLFRKFSFVFTCFGVGALLLLLATPRAVHAIAAVLVQVTNTAAAPAITQDVSKLASSQVILFAQAARSTTVRSDTNFVQVFQTSESSTPYQVPPGQKLIVTTADVIGVPGDSVGFFTSTFPNASWSPTLTGTNHFTYPSGIVLSAGDSPFMQTISTSTASGNMYVWLYGYLTSN